MNQGSSSSSKVLEAEEKDAVADEVVEEASRRSRRTKRSNSSSRSNNSNNQLLAPLTSPWLTRSRLPYPSPHTTLGISPPRSLYRPLSLSTPPTRTP